MTKELNLFDTPANIPADNVEEETGSYRERLVGEGKKFKDDEALAKGKWESDSYIKTLERKLDDLNKELGTRMSLEDFMKTQMKSSNNNGNDVSNSGLPAGNERSNVNEESKTLSKEEILNLAREAFQVEQSKAARSNNLREVQKTLMETWGARTYNDKLSAVAERLGLGQDFLQDIAARSPEAFYELVGAKKDQNVNTNVNIQNPPHSSVRPTTDTSYNPNIRNEAWWDKMKKDDIKAYMSEANTVRRHKDAQDMGLAFFTKR